MARAMYPQPRKHQQGRLVAPATTRGAPVGGWNARDPEDDMDSRDAVLMDNFFPRQRDVVTRPGYVETCDTGHASPILAMVEYEYGTTHKLLAMSASRIFDVTGATPTTLATGATGGEWISTMLGSRVLLVNGVDEAVHFTGSAIATTAWTGVDTRLLNFIITHKRRIFAIEKNSQKFWYGGVGAVQGALQSFDLSLTGSFGGNLLCAATISRDGGNGPDDYIVFVFTSGDCVIYSGSDPGDADDWARVGAFKIGRPLSRRALMDWGDDVLALTERGYESVKISLPLGDKAPKARMLSDKIQNAVSDAIRLAPNSSTWSSTLYPAGQMLIVNVPSGSTTVQHVMNINTQQWCRFRNIGAVTWCRFGTRVYFGTTAGKICRFDGTSSDNGRKVRCQLQLAWDYFGRRELKKKHTLQRLSFKTEYMPPVQWAIGVNNEPPRGGALFEFGPTPDLSYWGEAEWSEAYWSETDLIHQAIVKIGAVGHCASGLLTMDVMHAPVAVRSFQYIYTNGGYL